MEQITSVQNPKIKELLALQEKSRLRREKGVFVVEGRRELEHCINAGFKVRTVFICPEIAGVTDSVRMSVGIIPTDPFIMSLSLAGGSIIEVSRAVYDKVAYRGGTEGVIAEVYSKENSLESLELGENPLVIVLEGVEKPGNLGAVLRSADAAGVDAVLICDPLTDIYNPNLIRASIGAVFTQQVACCASSDAIGFLKRKGIRIYTAQLQDSEWYYDTDMRCGTAIAIGTEATGLTDQWREAADAHIKIPMLGLLDSLNASVSAAILLYEAVRQRNSNR
ncbi:MAG: RNA methyltransferase [Bacteroidales bacterium]|nr:RNA methyltransferase [Bacteroidales bacterium]